MAASGPMRTTETSAVVRRLAGQGHLIGDSWNPSHACGTHDHRYPATGMIQAEVGLAGVGDVEAAVDAARRAAPRWAAWSGGRRGAVLYRLAELLEAHAPEAAELGALDNGTPVNVMHPGHFAAAWVRYYAGWCDKLDGDVMSAERGLTFVRLEPYGVVAVIPPWNGSMMGMGQKCGPALAAGNTVVVKPPEIAPFGMLRFAELALEAGLPPGVLNVVVGGAETGAALVAHGGIDKISFTGGGTTARALMAAAATHLTPLALELGGKSPNIVFADADLDAAAAMAGQIGTGLLSGQGCALPTRTYVHDDVYDEFVTRLVTTVGALAVGDPLDPATTVGPVVTEAALERILGVIDRAAADGATLLVGGSR
ncbi:MAG: aldehyde dehydrogenase family protein, partial [Acidimicrobiales bacterium]